MKTISSYCGQRNNDKFKKTFSKLVEPPKNGVRMVLFLTEFDFNKPPFN